MIKQKNSPLTHLQSGSSAYFKTKKQAVLNKNRLSKVQGQVKLRIKRTNHLLRGKGWLLYTK